MKSSLFLRLSRLWLLVVSVAAVVGVARAQDREDTPPEVVYYPQQGQLEGVLAYTKVYEFTVKSPANVPYGSSLPVTIVPEMISTDGTSATPPGVSDAVALSYVSIAPAQFICTGPDEVTTIVVTVSMPAHAVPGQYGYKFSALGYPEDPSLGLLNVGTFLNGTVTAAGTTGEAPVIAIDTPLHGSSYTYQPNAFPAELPFSFVASVRDGSPVITSASADFGPVGYPAALETVLSGLDTRNVTGTGTLTIPGPGQYTLTARAANIIDTATDASTITINVVGLPPTVAIDTPTEGQRYTYRQGDVPVIVPYQFTARSRSGVITELVAKVDGVVVPYQPVSVGQATETRVVQLMYTASGAGRHELEVFTKDAFGEAIATSHFFVDVVVPEPAIVITTPADGAEIRVPAGATTVSVPYTFLSTSDKGFFVDSVTATVTNVATQTLSPVSTGLGTPAATSTGVMTGLVPGTYVLTATATSVGITVQDSVSFTVLAAYPPPTVVITAPPAGSTYPLTKVNGVVTPAIIPLTFTGTSQASADGFVITSLSATLNGNPLTVTSNTLNQAVAHGAASMVVNAAGTYQIEVRAVDGVGTATATRTFTVTVLEPQAITGTVFFDVNANGVKDGADYGLAGVTAKLFNSAGVEVASQPTTATGTYSFPGQLPGAYSVKTTASAGFAATTPTTVAVTMGGQAATANPIGYTINMAALCGMRADGFTIGYWKNNVDKAISGKSKGAQVSAAAINAYTNAIGAFALTPFNGLTKQEATAIMGSTSSAPKDLLKKQLLGSEYNYQNGAYLNGNGTLTYALVYWGEYILANAGSYPSSYVIAVKDLFDAYNNTHGGALQNCSSPTPPPPPTGGDTDNDCDRDSDRDCDDDDRGGSKGSKGNKGGKGGDGRG